MNGPERHIMEVVLVGRDGERQPGGEISDLHNLTAISPDARRRLARELLGRISSTVIGWSSMRVEGRTVSGRDEVIDSGLLFGAPLLLKGRLRPLHVTNETDWYPIDL